MYIIIQYGVIYIVLFGDIVHLIPIATNKEGVVITPISQIKRLGQEGIKSQTAGKQE
jgi:hypothetical protein